LKSDRQENEKIFEFLKNIVSGLEKVMGEKTTFMGNSSSNAAVCNQLNISEFFAEFQVFKNLKISEE